MNAVAVTDLHGNSCLYELLLRIADTWKISSIFISGDLAPSAFGVTDVTNVGVSEIVETQRAFFVKVLLPMLDAFFVGHRHTHVYAITGNDDQRANELLLREFDASTRNFHLVNDRMVELRDAKQIRTFFPDEVPVLGVAGYPYVPPGSGLLMDWVKYENSVRQVPPGLDPCMGIEQSGVSTPGMESETTIEEDLRDFQAFLEKAGRSEPLPYSPSRTIHLFHSPPYGTPLDRTAPRGRYDLVPLPDHIGSSEIRRFIGRTQPHLVLCGHCHESVVLGDYWTDIGDTRCVNAGSQEHIDVLSIVQFNPYRPSEMKQFFIHAH